MGKPTHFNIYTKGAGKAKPGVHFTGGAKGDAVRDFEIIDNHDYSYTVRYTSVHQVRLSFVSLINVESETPVFSVVCVSCRETCPSP